MPDSWCQTAGGHAGTCGNSDTGCLDTGRSDPTEKSDSQQLERVSSVAKNH